MYFSWLFLPDSWQHFQWVKCCFVILMPHSHWLWLGIGNVQIVLKGFGVSMREPFNSFISEGYVKRSSVRRLKFVTYSLFLIYSFFCAWKPGQRSFFYWLHNSSHPSFRASQLPYATVLSWGLTNPRCMAPTGLVSQATAEWLLLENAYPGTGKESGAERTNEHWENLQ